MTVEKIQGGGFVVTGKHIDMYMLLSIYRALKLEVDTGMKFSNRVNVANQARGVLVANGRPAPRNKTKLLEQYAKLLADNNLSMNVR